MWGMEQMKVQNCIFCIFKRVNRSQRGKVNKKNKYLFYSINAFTTHVAVSNTKHLETAFFLVENPFFWDTFKIE